MGLSRFMKTKIEINANPTSLQLTCPCLRHWESEQHIKERDGKRAESHGYQLDL